MRMYTYVHIYPPAHAMGDQAVRGLGATAICVMLHMLYCYLCYASYAICYLCYLC